MKTAILLALFAASPAFASTCNFEVNGEEATLSVDRSVTPAKASLKIGDEDLRAIGPCYAWSVPGRGALRCSFGSANYRVEVYPTSLSVKAIVWAKNGKATSTEGTCQD